MKTLKSLHRYHTKNIYGKILLFFVASSFTLSAQTLTRKSFVVGNPVNTALRSSIDAIALDQTFVATTARTTSRFEITIWNVSNNAITKKGVQTGSFAISSVRSAKLSNSRFVNAYSSDNTLKLQVWDVSVDGLQINLKDNKSVEATSSTSNEINIIPLSSTRFVTMVVAPDERLKMTVWDVSSNGLVTKKGSVVAFSTIHSIAASTLSSNKFVLAITNQSTPNDIPVNVYSVNSNGDITLLNTLIIPDRYEKIRMAALSNNRFVFSVGPFGNTGEDNLYSMNVSASNVPSIVATTSSPSARSGAITPLNSTNIVSLAHEFSGNYPIKLAHFKIQNDGSFVKKDEVTSENGSDGRATTLLTNSTLSRIVTAFISGGSLKLVSWDVNLSANARENTSGVENEISDASDINTYPNPVSNNATFTFHLNEDTNASIKIYNALGELIKEVATGKFSQGDHQVNCSVDQIPAGIYFYSLESGDKREMKKIVITH